MNLGVIPDVAIEIIARWGFGYSDFSWDGLEEEDRVDVRKAAELALRRAAAMISMDVVMKGDPLNDIETALEREVRDTHDFSSSAYSAFDDGFNSGVYEALEAVRKKWANEQA